MADIEILFFAPLYSFLIFDGTLYSDYCSTLQGHTEFIIIYYKRNQQLYCSVAKTSDMVQQNNFISISLKNNPAGGWLKKPILVPSEYLFSLFSPFTFETKRIKGKNIIEINGHSIYNHHSGANNINH